jgi:ABC-type polysaccharide/polyol phosphate export permease
MKSVQELIRSLWIRRELVAILVQRNLKIRYKGSVLGFFWSLASPVFFIVIYSTFLKLVTKGMPLPISTLVTGIIIWQFLSLCAHDSLAAIVGNVNLVKKTAFPRLILPLSTVLANLINFLMSGLVLLVFLAVTRANVQLSLLPLLPVVILTQTALCLGLAAAVSSAHVFFRDTEHLLGHVILAWLFLSPVLYPLERPLGLLAKLGAWSVPLYFLNPMAGLLAVYRMILVGEYPAVPPSWVGLSFAVAWLILGGGVVLFQKLQPWFGDEL